MPPTIGAAIRRITSEPVPLPHMIGRSPAGPRFVVSLERLRNLHEEPSSKDVVREVDPANETTG